MNVTIVNNKRHLRLNELNTREIGNVIRHAKNRKRNSKAKILNPETNKKLNCSSFYRNRKKQLPLLLFLNLD